MPHTPRGPRVTSLATGATLLVAALATAGPAAAAPGWGTLSTLEQAKAQACTVSVDGGEAWKVKLRVKNGNGYWVKATAKVFQDGVAQDGGWRSGRVARRSTSDVGTVRSGQGAEWTLRWSLSASQFGGGGERAVDGLRSC